MFSETVKALLAIIMLAIISMTAPLFSYAQSPPAGLPTRTPQPQCLDFDQDKICEYVVLANGTMIANPSVLDATMINSFTESQKTLADNNGTIAILLANGTIVQNATATPPPPHLCPDNDYDGRCGVETATVVNRCIDEDRNNICEGGV